MCAALWMSYGSRLILSRPAGFILVGFLQNFSSFVSASIRPGRQLPRAARASRQGRNYRAGDGVARSAAIEEAANGGGLFGGVILESVVGLVLYFLFGWTNPTNWYVFAAIVVGMAIRFAWRMRAASRAERPP